MSRRSNQKKNEEIDRREAEEVKIYYVLILSLSFMSKQAFTNNHFYKDTRSFLLELVLNHRWYFCVPFDFLIARETKGARWRRGEARVPYFVTRRRLKGIFDERGTVKEKPPLTETMIETRRAIEHVCHVIQGTNLPRRNIDIERRGASEHFAHIGNLVDRPRRNVRIKTYGIFNFGGQKKR